MGIDLGRLGNWRASTLTPPPTTRPPAPPPAAARPTDPTSISSAAANFNTPTPGPMPTRLQSAVTDAWQRITNLFRPTASPSGGGATYWNPVSTWNDQEQRILALVNATRSYYGIPPLQQRFGLSYMAAERSADMAVNQYFSHTDLYGRDPEQRFKDEGISYHYGGENIAYGQMSPDEVMQDWMNSPGHRANILDPNFKYLGVGIGQDSYGRLFWTQEFSG